MPHNPEKPLRLHCPSCATSDGFTACHVTLDEEDGILRATIDLDTTTVQCPNCDMYGKVSTFVVHDDTAPRYRLYRNESGQYFEIHVIKSEEGQWGWSAGLVASAPRRYDTRNDACSAAHVYLAKNHTAIDEWSKERRAHPAMDTEE